MWQHEISPNNQVVTLTACAAHMYLLPIPCHENGGLAYALPIGGSPDSAILGTGELIFPQSPATGHLAGGQ